MENSYTVYKHTFPNGKIYIGITNQTIERRWRYNGSGYKTQSLMYNAILKYGWDNIKHEILYMGMSKDEAEEVEIELISRYKSNQREYGYNVNNGGFHNGCHSEATRAKISIAKMGTRHTDEAKCKIRIASTGRYHTKETKMKRSKPVECIELNTVYFGIREAEKQLQISTGAISKCLNGTRHTAGGYHWRYAEKT